VWARNQCCTGRPDLTGADRVDGIEARNAVFATGGPLTLQGHQAEDRSVASAKGGKTVSGSEYRTIKFWDPVNTNGGAALRRTLATVDAARKPYLDVGSRAAAN
jgi:hypothetical protein